MAERQLLKSCQGSRKSTGLCLIDMHMSWLHAAPWVVRSLNWGTADEGRPVKGHDCLLPDQLAGVSEQLDGPWQHRIDEVWADQLADGCQRGTDYRQAHMSAQLQGR